METILPETAWMAYWPGLGLGIGYFAKHPTIFFLNIAGNILRAGVMDRHEKIVSSGAKNTGKNIPQAGISQFLPERKIAEGIQLSAGRFKLFQDEPVTEK